ncbi:MAG TPA: polysaccharide biosynthesis/export family protein [Planctomycetota bacterium]|nr:polysaccharide biosynthesis/export family protein [Planctomycetota bacterium]
MTSTLYRTKLSVALVLLACMVVCLGGCSSTSPDKRLLQYLNQEGFGNRYTGNPEEDNYITIDDTLEITDSYHPDELTLTGLVVDIDGTVVLPELGAVFVAGQTRSELEAYLLEKYSPYYTKLDVKVKIHTKGKVYFIFGEVGAQGAQPFKGDLTVFEAVMSAQPDARTANLGRVQVIRPDPRDGFSIFVNIDDMFQHDSTSNIHIQERDIVYVPPTMVAEFGYFLSAMIFPITQVLNDLRGSLFIFGYGGRGNNRRGGGTVF